MSRNLIYYFLFLLPGLLCPIPVAAQKQATDTTLAGIYRSYQDFADGTLSYSVDCSREKQKIRLHAFMQKPFLEIFYRGEKIRLNKIELFGYQDCRGDVFRFYCNQEYQLAEIRDLSIYFSDEDTPIGTGFVRERLFYFCVTPDGPLLPLTLQNLKILFSSNQKFMDILSSTVKADSDLCYYDDEHRTFRVNYLYALSKQ